MTEILEKLMHRFNKDLYRSVTLRQMDYIYQAIRAGRVIVICGAQGKAGKTYLAEAIKDCGYLAVVEDYELVKIRIGGPQTEEF